MTAATILDIGDRKLKLLKSHVLPADAVEAVPSSGGG